MKNKLSSWWEENTNQPYVARRSLVTPERSEKFAPLTHFIVYYCGANFAPQHIESKNAGLAYLVQGEKEPVNALEDSPWVRYADEMIEMVGGAIRQDVPEIIPVLYVSLGFSTLNKQLAFSSDQVPLSEDANRTVRVLCGQFENVSHSVPTPKDVSVLDVVLAQGGKFVWSLPSHQQAFVYVVSGKVNIGNPNATSECYADSLIWVNGKQIEVSTQCAGGRFFVVTLPKDSQEHASQDYVQEVLPDLEQAKN